MTSGNVNYLPVSNLSRPDNSIAFHPLCFDFASIATSCLRDQIRASLTFMQLLKNQPRGREACVCGISEKM